MTRSRLSDYAWRTAYRAAYLGLRIWWRVWPVAHRGALVALHVDGKLLLIRNSYRRGWTLPGGGVEPGDASIDAAIRELREELGLVVTMGGVPIVVTGAWEGRPETVDIFDLTLSTEPSLQVDDREVIEARFVDPTALSIMKLTGPAAAYAALRWPLPAGDEHPCP